MPLATRTAFPLAGNQTALPADSIAFNGTTATVVDHALANRLHYFTVGGITDPVLITRDPTAVTRLV